MNVVEACDPVADLLGVGSSRVYNVRNEAKATDSVLIASSRNRPARVHKDRRTTLYDYFTKCALRTSVHSFFRPNEVPTATKIAAQFPASDDLPDLTLWTHSYMRDIATYQEDGRPIHYLDETWVCAGHTVSKVSIDSTVTSSHDAFMRGLPTGLKQLSGRGQRLIISHVRNKGGFIDGCLDIFRGRKTGDYHEEMDGSRSSGQSCANNGLSQGCNRAVIKGVPYDAGMRKKELLDIVSSLKPRFHAPVKNGVAARNRAFKLSDVEDLLREKVEKVTAVNWPNAERHLRETKTLFFRKSGGTDHIRPRIIMLDRDDASDDSSRSERRDDEDPLPGKSVNAA
ncbi:hypothetical protein HPB52_010575 [Rhipicephalus sanguineus]|uniref:Uncharacterized protein n=1 Tax=Rhipicephalus sanguineus TaxID=34632 RepID=A0A9D4Q6T9_RHISA|nr:hypothetical protein HPB52_010575 [Rhipicephalus sanguineus]